MRGMTAWDAFPATTASAAAAATDGGVFAGAPAGALDRTDYRQRRGAEASRQGDRARAGACAACCCYFMRGYVVLRVDIMGMGMGVGRLWAWLWRMCMGMDVWVLRWRRACYDRRTASSAPS